MQSINLSTESTPEKKSFSWGTGIVSASVVLLLILGLYGGLIFMKKNLNTNIEGVTKEYDIEYRKFLAGSGGDIIDFKNRSVVAAELIEKNEDSGGDVFSNLESIVLPSVFLNSLKYDKDNGVIKLACVGENFDAVSKQIASFKESAFLSSINVGQVLLDSQNNKLNFTVSLNLK